MNATEKLKFCHCNKCDSSVHYLEKELRPYWKDKTKESIRCPYCFNEIVVKAKETVSSTS